jgi:hypothetical protein
METALRAIQDMWQVPYICQFVKLFHGSLNIEPFTPEELELAILAPQNSPLCAELISKLLLKKSSHRRELALGEGFNFERWHDMMTKQISNWYKIYQRYQRVQKSEKFGVSQRLAIQLFEELEGNPFILPPSSPKAVVEENPQPVATAYTTGQRATRSHTNSLPRTRKPRYTEDFFNQSSEFEEEERFKHLGEIKEEYRVIVIYYLCIMKLETEEELKHELQYVPMAQMRLAPLGIDGKGSHYFYFHNTDCRIYKSDEDKFQLVAKTIDQVKELIVRLQASNGRALALTLNNMMEQLQANEQERTKRMLANIRRVHSAPGRKRLNTDYDYEDSDFSPVEDDFPRKRGPGRPRKIPLPERKPKIMPETSGNQIVLEGKLKRITTHSEILYTFSGYWNLPGKPSQDFKFLHSDSGSPGGVYTGFWQYYSKAVEETLDVKLENNSVSGCGENMFGLFQVEGSWQPVEEEEILGEKVIGNIVIRRTYCKMQLTDESSCSEAEQEIFDAVKPPYRLDFEEKVHLEHMRMPLKTIQELKRTLKAQEKRELRRVAFYKSEYLS